MTVEQFLDWLDGQPGDARYELVDGEIVAMGREAVEHARLKLAATIAFRDGIRRAGAPCEAIIDGPGILLADNGYLVPDVIVACGERVEGDSSIVPNPLIVVEVLSAGTRVYDAEVKLAYYFAIPSIAHYLIVDGKTRQVLHHRRTGAAEALTQFSREGDILLDPPGITVPVTALFGAA
jgi:Uma2 family endonuclease